MTAALPAAIIMAVAAMAVALPQLAAAEEMPVAELAARTHFHGLVIDPQYPSRLLLATHHGLYAVSPEGLASKLSETGDDFMGLHPAQSPVLFASGHPERGGNAGLVMSRNGGRTWSRLADGAELYGRADFHMLDVSKADPNVMYGVYGELQVSRDGGRTWETVDVPPRRMVDLAASAKHPNTLYAATEAGLMISSDGGRSWRKTALSGRPVAFIEVTADGSMWSFVLGQGLMRGQESSPDWTILSEDFGERVLVHLAVDRSGGERLYALTQHNEILASTDAGKSWQVFGSR